MNALTTFGQLLKAWRDAKHVTQEELSFRSGLSSKHISYLETGRAQPSKDAILAVSTALDIPHREVNVLLGAAGQTAHYLELKPDAQTLLPVRRAIDSLLEKHLPFPAWVVDGRFDVITLNRSALAINQLIIAQWPDFPSSDPMFHPLGLRRCIVNWEEIATQMLRRMQREILMGRKAIQATFDRVMTYPGIPNDWRHRAPMLSIEPTIELQLLLGDRNLSFLTTLTTFASALDTYVQEVTIESCFPVNSVTEVFCHELQKVTS